MKNGSARFEYYLSQLQTLLAKAAKQKNPALWLYQNNARTLFFMLEALAKLYAGIYNKKKFAKLKEQFKLLEDSMGAIDYYDSFAKEFASNKKIPAAVKNYIQAQSREKIQSLNEILKEKEWLSEGNVRIGKIRKKLSEADWQKEKEDIESIYDFYAISINKLLEFINQKNFHFDNVEADVHELRRKLRWLSIYPQALRGVVQISKTKTTPKYLEKYLTAAITSSPYNIMPDAGDNKHFLILDKNRFYALSWLISELGKLKDSGLRVIAVSEAVSQTGMANAKGILKKTYELLGNDQAKLQQLLDNAENILKTFCKEKNLESLLIGTAAV